MIAIVIILILNKQSYHYSVEAKISIMHRKIVRKRQRKVVCGIKLPPIEKFEEHNMKTIIDIDPHFYSQVEGRPIKPNNSLRNYKQNIRQIALKRTLYGFLMDEVLRITREIETERKIYTLASKHFEEYQHSFDKFLDDDNNKTIIIMKKSDSLAKELANQTEGHKKANFEVATIKSKLQYIQESLQILISFQCFLHRAAPILWQQREKISSSNDSFEVLKKDSDMFVEVNKTFIQARLNQLPAPRLYFEAPHQLLAVFDLLEKQNLNYLLVTEDLNSEKNKFIKSLCNLKSQLTQELDHIKEKMRMTEEIIIWNELREVELKQAFHRILEDKIRYLVSSETVLQIFHYVQFAYEQIIAPNDANLGSLDMILSLEREYNNIMLELSAFDLDILKLTEKETYENEANEIKRAKNASKLLNDVEKLSRRLKSSYEPSRAGKYEKY